MRIADVMTRDVKLANPDQSLADAARMMADGDCGILPVADNDRLVGMITDRDIVVRGLAHGKNADTPIRDVMSAEVKYCFEEDDLSKVAHNMGELQVRRMPVVNQDKRLVGILSLADIALNEPEQATETLCDICEPGTQSGSATKATGSVQTNGSEQRTH